ncbi:MAG: hypothetical protein ACI4GZ_03655 [Ruminococcus sp.]
MKYLLSFSLIISILFTFCGCRRVIISSADELTSRSWQCETSNGMNASLEFDGDFASFEVRTASQDEICRVAGALSVDKERFYITSDEFASTYTFSYQVFKDRAEITYNDCTLTFTLDGYSAENETE